MQIIKLDATDSTNNFLKKLTASGNAKNFVVVSAKSQTSGRGQMGAKWHSEPHKNLTMSVLVSNYNQKLTQIFDFSVMVSVSVFESLEAMDIPNLSIKWPNDIMADGKKIGGILIENIVNAQKIDSIVGIGINVNQSSFTDLPRASSLYNICGKYFDIEALILDIAQRIKDNFENLVHQSDFFWIKYHANLFKKDVLMSFENNQGMSFLGTIRSVDRNGNIHVEVFDSSCEIFEVKQINMVF